MKKSSHANFRVRVMLMEMKSFRQFARGHIDSDVDFYIIKLLVEVLNSKNGALNE